MFAKSVIDMTPGQGTFGEMCLRSRIGYFCIAMSDKHAEYLTCKLRLAALKFMAEEGCPLYNPRYATALGATTKVKAKAKAKSDPNKDPEAPKAKAKATTKKARTKRATVGAGAEKRKSKKQKTAEDKDDAGNGTGDDADDDDEEEGTGSAWDLSGSE